MPFGVGRGSGKGRGRRGKGGRGMRSGRSRFHRRNLNLAESCVCPNCETVVAKQRGVPCFQTACPNCGAQMTRQFNVPGIFTPQQEEKIGNKPIVDQEECTGCKKCISACPEHAIDLIDSKAFINHDKCTNCRVCITICPVSAIL